MPYTYATPVNPYVASIGELLQRRGDIGAMREERIAAANARAAEASGDVWGRAFAGLGNTIAGTIAQATDPRRQMDAMNLQHAKDLRAGEQVVDRALQPVTPTGPQPEGEGPAPAQQAYLSDDGLVDPTKVTALLNANGMGHLAPDLLKGIEAQNSSIAAYKDHQQATATKQTIMLGSVANTTLGLMKAGMPFQDAAAHASSSLVATGVVPLDVIQKQVQQLAALPPDQQIASLQQMKATAARLGPTKTLSEGAKEVDIFGDAVAANPKNEKPTEASLAADAATLGTPQETPTAKQSAAALAKLKPPPPRSESEQAMDAYAKSIGKTRSEELTDPERQAYIKRDAEQKAAAAFAQHKNERNYDVANPVPVKGKSQDELEQEARGVLQREFSSRSGGLGQEDGKVDQAIHLLALMDQYDGKNMPAQIHAELALGLARLTSPNGQVGIELEKEFRQKTAQEGIAKGIAYLTGDPQLVNATPEKLREMLRDSITRQGNVAQHNRQTYLDAMVSMLPTTLEQRRRDAIAQGTKLNRMPAPSGAPAVGTTRNGATWKDGPQGWGWYR